MPSSLMVRCLVGCLVVLIACDGAMEPGTEDELELFLSEATVEFDQLGSTRVVEVRQGRSAETSTAIPGSPVVELLGEIPVLEGIPVASPIESRGQVSFRAEGPGTARFRLSFGNLEPVEVGVEVTTSEPMVTGLAAPALVQGEVTIRLQGLNLDALPAGAHQVDGAQVNPSSITSTEVVFSIPARDLSGCSGFARAVVSVSGARLLGDPDLTVAYPSEDAVDLAVGEVLHLGRSGDRCLRLPGGATGEYILGYVDTRPIEQARERPEDGDWLNDALTVRVGHGDDGMLTRAGSRLDAPARRGHLSPQAVPPNPPTNAYHLITKPLKVGDRIGMPSQKGFDWTQATVLRVHDWLVTIDLDENADRQVASRLSVWDETASAVSSIMPGIVEPALGPIPETVSGTGQVLVVLTPLNHTGGVYYTELGYIALNGDNTVTDDPLYIYPDLLAHEVGHAWQFAYLERTCDEEEACSFYYPPQWGLEGGADFIATEVERRLKSIPLRSDRSWLLAGYSSFYWSAFDGAPRFGRGYFTANWFLRDQMLQAIDAGASVNDAFAAVARGSIEGWFGVLRWPWETQLPGMTGRMSEVLGTEYDPAIALVDAAGRLAADDRGLAGDLYPTVFDGGSIFRDDGEPRIVAGTPATVAWDTRSWTFGWLVLDDGGRGAGYRLTASAPEIDWVLVRIR